MVKELEKRDANLYADAVLVETLRDSPAANVIGAGKKFDDGCRVAPEAGVLFVAPLLVIGKVVPPLTLFKVKDEPPITEVPITLFTTAVAPAGTV